MYVYLSLEDGETIIDSLPRVSRVILQESRALVQQSSVLLYELRVLVQESRVLMQESRVLSTRTRGLVYSTYRARENSERLIVSSDCFFLC